MQFAESVASLQSLFFSPKPTASQVDGSAGISDVPLFMKMHDAPQILLEQKFLGDKISSPRPYIPVIIADCSPPSSKFDFYSSRPTVGSFNKTDICSQEIKTVCRQEDATYLDNLKLKLYDIDCDHPSEFNGSIVVTRSLMMSSRVRTR